MSVEISGLCFSYGRQEILRDVCFSAADGDMAAVLGPNGVGKSTFFRCLLGFLKADAGSVIINGKDIRSLSRPEAAREIAYIPQSCVPAFNYTLLDVALMGLTNRLSLFQTPTAEHRELAMQALESMGVAHLAHRGCGQVSGGERQLALLARAIAQNARVLVMDEPTASLDCGNSFRVLEHIAGLTQQGYTVIFSTHDPNQALRRATRVLVLQNGGTLAFGSPREALTGETLSALYGIPMAVEVLDCGGERIPVSLPLGSGTQH